MGLVNLGQATGGKLYGIEVESEGDRIYVDEETGIAFTMAAYEAQDTREQDVADALAYDENDARTFLGRLVAFEEDGQRVEGVVIAIEGLEIAIGSEVVVARLDGKGWSLWEGDAQIEVPEGIPKTGWYVDVEALA